MFRRPVFPALLIAATTPFVVRGSLRAENEADLYQDYSAKFPWFPKFGGPITSAEKAGFDRLRAMPRYNPAPITPRDAGLTEESLAALEKRVAAVLDLTSDPTAGTGRGRPLVFTGEGGASQSDMTKPANFAADFYPLFSEAANAYVRSKGDARRPVTDALRARARSLLARLAAHLASRPWDGAASGHPAVWIGNGYGWRDRDGGMGLRLLAALPLLETPALRAGYLDNIFWIQGSVGMDRYSGLSTDDYTNVAHQILAAVSLMPDCPAKRQRLVMMRHALETSMLRPGAHGTVSADGGVIHHGFAHNAYAAYEFGPLCRLLRDVAAAGAPATHDTPEVISRLYAAARARAWTTQPGATITSLEGRPIIPFAGETARVSRAGGGELCPIVAATARAIGGAANDPREIEMAALFRAKNPAAPKPAEFDGEDWNAADQLPFALQGDLPYPVACATIHRRGDWVVVVRGSAKNRTGGEGQPYTNPGSRQSMGGLYCRGSILLLADGATPGAPPDLVSSGHAADGFDTGMMPGVTALRQPWEKRIGGYFGSDARFCASAALDGQGAWGYRPSFAAKSCFLIGNRITAVTSDAAMKRDGDAPLVTCAVQTRRRDADTAADTLDGAPLAEGDEKRLDDRRPHTLLTSAGHGYYFHAATEPLVISSRIQESRFMEQALLKPESAKEGTWSALMAKDMTNGKRAAALDKFKPLSGRFLTAFWDHGTDAAQSSPVAFTLLVRSGRDSLDTFARRMDSPAPPVRITVSRTAHALHDLDSGFRGVVFFEGGKLGPEHDANGDIPLRASDRPCAVMLRRDRANGMLRLAISAGENAFFENGHASAGRFTLTFAGRWKALSPDTVRAEIRPGGETVVTLAVDDVRGETLILKPAP